jgi:hypothetical protein
MHASKPSKYHCEALSTEQLKEVCVMGLERGDLWRPCVRTESVNGEHFWYDTEDNAPTKVGPFATEREALLDAIETEGVEDPAGWSIALDPKDLSVDVAVSKDAGAMPQSQKIRVEHVSNGSASPIYSNDFRDAVEAENALRYMADRAMAKQVPVVNGEIFRFEGNGHVVRAFPAPIPTAELDAAPGRAREGLKIANVLSDHFAQLNRLVTNLLLENRNFASGYYADNVSSTRQFIKEVLPTWHEGIVSKIDSVQQLVAREVSTSEQDAADAERYRKLRAYMGRNQEASWKAVERLAAVACYVGTDAFDEYLDGDMDEGPAVWERMTSDQNGTRSNEPSPDA